MRLYGVRLYGVGYFRVILGKVSVDPDHKLRPDGKCQLLNLGVTKVTRNTKVSK